MQPVFVAERGVTPSPTTIPAGFQRKAAVDREAIESTFRGLAKRALGGPRPAWVRTRAPSVKRSVNLTQTRLDESYYGALVHVLNTWTAGTWHL